MRDKETAVAKDDSKSVVIHEVKKGFVQLGVLGTRPTILNRMSEKARRELLLPGRPKTTADKASNLKHNPFDEFRASPYIIPDDDAPTLLACMSASFKKAMATAALDMPGAKKAQVGRLVYVQDDLVPIYGEPRLLMSVVRSADINHTPDIRTRVIIPRWAAIVSIEFVTPIMKVSDVVNLLAGGGITSGIGDWRPQKGAGDYGQYKVVQTDDPDLLEVIRGGGRKVQQAAMADPMPYDAETAELLSWYDTEAARRGFSSKAA